MPEKLKFQPQSAKLSERICFWPTCIAAETSWVMATGLGSERPRWSMPGMWYQRYCAITEPLLLICPWQVSSSTW